MNLEARSLLSSWSFSILLLNLNILFSVDMDHKRAILDWQQESLDCMSLFTASSTISNVTWCDATIIMSSTRTASPPSLISSRRGLHAWNVFKHPWSYDQWGKLLQWGYFYSIRIKSGQVLLTTFRGVRQVQFTNRIHRIWSGYRSRDTRGRFWLSIIVRHSVLGLDIS